jgi:hypothetical protein
VCLCKCVDVCEEDVLTRKRGSQWALIAHEKKGWVCVRVCVCMWRECA